MKSTLTKYQIYVVMLRGMLLGFPQYLAHYQHLNHECYPVFRHVQHIRTRLQKYAIWGIFRYVHLSGCSVKYVLTHLLIYSIGTCCHICAYITVALSPCQHRRCTTINKFHHNLHWHVVVHISTWEIKSNLCHLTNLAINDTISHFTGTSGPFY